MTTTLTEGKRQQEAASMIKQIKHIEAEDGLKTYVTKDYDQFVMMEDNRSIHQQHVRDLIETIEAHPDGLRREPILVNEKMEIIDGQHRLKAVEALGYPAYYQIERGLSVDDAVRMNVYRRNWTPLDFAYSYAGRGNENYQRYLSVHHQHEDLQHETLVNYLRNGDTKRSYVEFRNGQFIVLDDDDRVNERIDRYLQIVALLPNPRHGKTSTFARAYLSVMKHKTYDHERMVSKMEYAASKYLNTPFLVVEDASRALESVYNENARANDRVRLF
jgi:hypothetical protein